MAKNNDDARSQRRCAFQSVARVTIVSCVLVRATTLQVLFVLTNGVPRHGTSAFIKARAVLFYPLPNKPLIVPEPAILFLAASPLHAILWLRCFSVPSSACVPTCCIPACLDIGKRFALYPILVCCILAAVRGTGRKRRALTSLH